MFGQNLIGRLPRCKSVEHQLNRNSGPGERGLPHHDPGIGCDQGRAFLAFMVKDVGRQLAYVSLLPPNLGTCPPIRTRPPRPSRRKICEDVPDLHFYCLQR